MAEDLAEARGPTVAEVVRQTIRHLPLDVRRGLGIVLIAWLTVVALHVWESQERPAARAIAEIASVLLGTAGLLLFSLTEVLRRAEEPTAGPGSVLRIGAGTGPVPESAGLRRLLLALPTLGSLAAASLAGAVAIVVVRVFLGTSPVILAIAAVYLAGLAAALQVVGRSAQRLFAFGQRESARVARAEAQLSDARLAALQAQMQPHFLFNALNTVASLVRTDPDAAERTIENLSEVLRRTLERSRTTHGTVRDEIEFVRAWLAIERQRFGDRLEVEWDVDPAALDAALPPLTIQPLVENALKHAIAPRRDGGRLRVAVACTSDRLRLEVADNGEGLASPAREGTGLGNLRSRLAVLYGDAASLELQSSEAGTRARVVTPLATASVPPCAS